MIQKQNSADFILIEIIEGYSGCLLPSLTLLIKTDLINKELGKIFK
jgi:hypothetical protein